MEGLFERFHKMLDEMVFSGFFEQSHREDSPRDEMLRQPENTENDLSDPEPWTPFPFYGDLVKPDMMDRDLFYDSQDGAPVSLIWCMNNSVYHKVAYWLVGIPALIRNVLSPHYLKDSSDFAEILENTWVSSLQPHSVQFPRDRGFLSLLANQVANQHWPAGHKGPTGTPPGLIPSRLHWICGVLELKLVQRKRVAVMDKRRRPLASVTVTGKSEPEAAIQHAACAA
ncbi:uncharacterized protein DEA37_0000532 [Paragonimus westermani]|uniref:Uncharacterized protein n=1 Tax=Paragonimus westermani TaxID=34504 RepID=A0A5J4NMN8_9TREM|nr:uncharacterized protein DEA37_0000532 [Paragonimus westermani]